MLFVVLFCLIFNILHCGDCCLKFGVKDSSGTKTQEKQNKQTITKQDVIVPPVEIFNHNYSFLKPLSRYCHDIIEDMTPLHSSDFEIYYRNKCTSLLPGLSLIQYGTNSYEYAFPSVGIVNSYDKLFQFHCSQGRIYAGYPVPDEVREVLSVDQIRFSGKRVTSETLLQTFQSDPEFKKPSSLYASGLAKLQVNLKKGDSVMYLQCQVRLYFAICDQETRISPHARAEFYKLPLKFKGNVKTYNKFAITFGRDIMKQAYIGGDLIIIVNSDRIPYKYRNLTEFDLKSVVEITKNITDTTVGPFDVHEAMEAYGGNGSTGIEGWIASLRQYPVVIGATFKPISQVIEPDGSSMRSLNFDRIRQFEKRRTLLRRTQFQLSNILNLNQLGQFVLNSVRHEIKHACPSPEFNRFLENEIIGVGNVNFAKFGIDCSLYDKSSKPILYLTNGVCLNVDGSAISCSYPEAIRPDGTEMCFKFYDGPNCIEDSAFLTITSRTQIRDYIYYVKSISLC